MRQGSSQGCAATRQEVTGKNEHRKFCIKMSKNSITMSVLEHWNKLPRDVVETPFLKIFKTYLKAILAAYCRESALAGVLIPRGSFQPL